MEINEKTSTKALQGAALGVLVFILLSSSLYTIQPASAKKQNPLFSVDLLVTTNNPIRVTCAQLIAANLQSVGIDARLQYTTFDDLLSRLFPSDVSQLGKSYADGGFDIGFIGWGFTTSVPDIKALYMGTTDAYPPSGNNYLLYNSVQANALLNQIYTSNNPNKQLGLFRQLSLVLNRDKPNIPIFLPSDVIARKPSIKIYGDSNAYTYVMTYNNAAYSYVTNPNTNLQYMSGLTSYTLASAGSWTSLAPWATTDSNSLYSLYVYGETQGGLQLLDTRTGAMFLNEAQSITESKDGRTWTIKIKPGILFQDGVEATADDYLFTERALMTPAVDSSALGDELSRFGNLVQFTWLNGTTTRVDNSNGALTQPTSTFKALDRYTYQFTIGPTIQPYAFMMQTDCAIAPLPKHYLEQIPFQNWNQSPYATGFAGAYTFHWNTAKYGGSSHYTAYGPFGTGPYVYKGYNSVTQTASLVKFDKYFNRAKLEKQGYYTVRNYNVVTITDKSSAISAYGAGIVDDLDVNYILAADQATLKSLGANVFSKPELGWQELGFNMQNPIFGTGLSTPAGLRNPIYAAEAARHVRQAISYLIPRDYIVNQVKSGAAEKGTTILKIFGSIYQDPSITSDPYSPSLARAELAKAGYFTP